jgi:hypothetical protein
MGIYTGTVAFNRFRVSGTGKKHSINQLSTLLDPFKSPLLRIDGAAKAEVIGWVRPLTPQDANIMGEDAHWDISDSQVSSGIMLRLRYERRKISTSLLQMLFKNELAKNNKASGKTMGRQDRMKLKEEIASTLLRRTLPQISFVDVLWKDTDLGNGTELYIFSSSTGATDRVLQLFNQTFSNELDLTLTALNTTAAWIESDESDVRLDRIAKTEPSIFAQNTV